MALGDLHKKLYSHSDEIEKRELADDPFNPIRKRSAATPKGKEAFQVSQEVWLDKESSLGGGRSLEQEVEQGKKQYLKIGLITFGGLFLLAMLTLGVVKYKEAAFSEEKIIIKIDGPSEIKSGGEAIYRVSVTNMNRVDLEQVTMGLNYSEDFSLEDQPFILKEGLNNSKIDVGLIEAKGKKEFDIKAKIFGPTDKQIYFNVSLKYQPSNFSSLFEKKAQLSGVIKSSLLSLNIISSREASSGDDVEVQLIVRNISNEAFSDIEIRMDYPEGFSFKRSDLPTAKENRYWELEKIGPLEERKIVIVGSLEGNEETVRSFKATIGRIRAGGDFNKYSEAESTTKIIPQRIQVQQFIKGKKEYYANAGEVIDYTIKFKNNTTFPLRDLVITESIDSPVLAKEQVEPKEGGYYDSQKNEIVWKAANTPVLKSLEPSGEGEVSFKIKVADDFPMQSETDKNFLIVSQASIDSLDIDSPLGQNKKISSAKMETKVNSKLVLSVSSSYADGELPNTGPVPPKVGQESTFTVRFNLLNTSNNLRNVIVTASLPAGVKWKQSYLPETSGIEFNERTNELKWIVGTVDAGTGFISPVKSLAFQIGITPSVNQVGAVAPLLNAVKATALDSFTSQHVEYGFSRLDTGGVSDLGHEGGIVQAGQ